MNFNPTQKEIDFVNDSLARFNDKKVGPDNHELLNIVEYDSKGNVIGIVVAGVPGAENVGYAIKISYLKILIESAGLNITFPTNNTVATLSLAEQVKRVKRFVFYIECSK